LLAALRGQFAVAARILGGVSALEERYPPWIDESWLRLLRRSRTAALQKARTALGEEAFAAAWDEGGALSPESLLAEARALAADRAQTPK
jgi:hypothetical protein